MFTSRRGIIKACAAQDVARTKSELNASHAGLYSSRTGQIKK